MIEPALGERTGARSDARQTDLFALGRAAAAAARSTSGDRVVFARSRQLLSTGVWRGPRDAADAYVEEEDLAQGLQAAIAAGARTLVTSSVDHAAEARAAGLRVVLRVPFSAGEAEVERVARLHQVATHAPAIDGAARAPLIDGIMPTSIGEPLGLDTLRLFALCRLYGGVPHVVADFARLGHRLAQMCLAFGADELHGPIVAERALRLGDNANNPALTRKEAALLIRAAGLAPFERLAGGVLAALDKEQTP